MDFCFVLLKLRDFLTNFQVIINNYEANFPSVAKKHTSGGNEQSQL